ncbi:Ig-like domain-containing protein [Lacihabitans lacunae]|uniref:Ig-like domain-containing protein n=1 Tax=Lacihabitans lacunae TaxID=1028214 RepID=A0ABV7Z323_9BACT
MTIFKLKHYFLKVFLLVSISGFAQTPSFTLKLSPEFAFVCKGGDLKVSAKVQNATSYQFQTYSESLSVWQNVNSANGDPSTNEGNISHTFYTITVPIKVRVLISNGTETTISNEHTISPQQPTFDFISQDQYICNGSSVIFYANAQGASALSYKWFEADETGGFSQINNSGKYANATTASLSINSATTSFHLNRYFAEATDQQGCTNNSTISKLHINSLSAIQPTASTPFCEGDTIEFFSSKIVGTAQAFDWLTKPIAASTYQSISDDENYAGTKTERLTVTGIQSSELGFRLSVDFLTKTQSNDGSISEGTCTLNATRTGYTINQRPLAPTPPNDQSFCGPSVFTFETLEIGNFNWYKDTLTNALLKNSTSFETPKISETSKYYISQKDNKGCESFRREFEAKVINRPSAKAILTEEICPSAAILNLEISDLTHDPSHFYFTKGENELNGFEEIRNASLNQTNEITLPTIKNAGTYDFKFFVKNNTTGCYSDTSNLSLTILENTKITTEPASAILCEGGTQTLSVVAGGEGPFSYKWLKDSNPIEDETNASLAFENITNTASGNYTVEVSGKCSTINSETAIITVKPKPSISKQPENVIVCENTTASFEIEATGSGTLIYTWYKNDEAVGENAPRLTLENLPLSDNQAIIKCKISGECEPAIWSNEAVLSVDDIPNAPIIKEIYGFCQNQTDPTINPELLAKHTEIWMNQSGDEIPKPSINTSETTEMIYFVAQKDSNSCKSPSAQVNIKISGAIINSIRKSTPAICETGNFNSEAIIYSLLTHIESEDLPISYQLYLDEKEISENSEGNFTVQSPGLYTLKVQKGFCSIENEVNINSLIPEIKNEITTQNVSVCLGQNATLYASGDFTAGAFNWWQDPYTGFNLATGESFTIQNIQNPQTIYVSYLAQKDDLYCESERKAIEISLKPSLELDIIATPPLCGDQNSGSIKINPETGIEPFSFSINSEESIPSGEFLNLAEGEYQIKVSDAEGCIKDTLVVLEKTNKITILQQPQNVIKCKTNVANFSITATNYTSVIWQRKTPLETDFTDIIGETNLNLKIGNSGDSENPHLSEYRVKLSSADCEVFSEVASLFVNSVEGSNASTTVCEGQPLTYDLASYEITGNINTSQWQYRVGTSGSWSDLESGGDSIYSFAEIRKENEGYYRNRIVFETSESGTCIINTSSSGRKLTVVIPEVPTLEGNTTVCLGQSAILKASACNGQIIWSNAELGNQITVSPTASTYYKAKCLTENCESWSVDSLLVEVIPFQTTAPVVSVNKTTFCQNEEIILNATTCEGEIVWSNGEKGVEVKLIANESFEISAICKGELCSSGTSNILKIEVISPLIAGEISTNTTINCAGFNPGVINSLIDPTGGKNIKVFWQMSENCNTNSPNWVTIANETGLSFNPSALSVSTCFRRIVSDSCTSFLSSNISEIKINPDPQIEIETSVDSLCFGLNTQLTSNIIGGVSPCEITWQKNYTSSSQSSSNWETVGTASSFNFVAENVKETTKVFLRAIIDCELSSCKKAYSAPLEIWMFPSVNFEQNFTDSTICEGNQITLTASGCKSEVVWSNGSFGENITVTPITNTSYSATCSQFCGSESKSFNINVLPGIPKPISTTPASVLFPNPLLFTADGQNLKWYTSEVGGIAETTNPTRNDVGMYTYYVSQTIGICESPRLKIEAEILAQLAINSQTEEFRNCAGNLATFEIEAKGAGEIKYLWQRKRQNEPDFSDLNSESRYIENFDTETLKVRSIGNDENPDGTLFRCILKDDFATLTSANATLWANKLDGRLDNQKKCLGQLLEFNLNTTHRISGTPLSINWQSRPGTNTEWTNLQDNHQIIGSETLHLRIRDLGIENEMQYRCSVLFENTAGTCVENTDLSTVTVGEFPPTPDPKSFEFCQGDKSPKLELFLDKQYDDFWYLENSELSTEYKSQPKIDTETPGDFVLFYRIENKAGCSSELVTVPVKIHPEAPYPFNTTPSSVKEGTELVFTANGENLKWYSSRTGRTFKEESPRYTKVDQYDHYVSQTSAFGCEGPRLYIESEILPILTIKTNPSDQTNCNGNTVTFSIKAESDYPITYQWQIKTPSDVGFRNIEGANDKNYKIPDVGDELHPHLSLFRCIVKDQERTEISSEARLFVNEVLPGISDLTFCAGSSVTFNDLKSTFIGDYAQIEWQLKDGSSYETQITTLSESEGESIDNLKTGTYRLRFAFTTKESSTCIRYSDNFQVVVNPLPTLSQNKQFEVCQFELKDNLKLGLANGTKWYLGQKDSISLTGTPKFLEAGNFEYWIDFTDQNSCVSPRQKVTIEVNESPEKPKLDTVYSFCKYSDPIKILKSEPQSIYWFKDLRDDDPTEDFFVLKSSEISPQVFYAASISENACFSDKVKVTMIQKTCYEPTNTLACNELSQNLEASTAWRDFYTKEGKVVIRINTNGQFLGKTKISYALTENTYFKDQNNTEFYPRHFNLQTEKPFKSPISIRFFMSNQEIDSFKTIKNTFAFETALIHYIGPNQDCELTNNPLENSYWLIDHGFWQNTEDVNFSYLEAQVAGSGEYLLWDAVVPNATLSAEIKENPELKIDQNNDLSNGSYQISKKSFDTEYFSLKTFKLPTSSLILTDSKPFNDKNIYGLSYDYGNQIKMKLNEVEVVWQPKKLKCMAIGNPSRNHSEIKLYFPEADPKTLKIQDILGRQVFIQGFETKEDYIKISASTNSGIYTISGLNNNLQKCSTKILIY